MQIAPGIYSMGQDKGGHVHAYLLDDGNGLTLLDTLYDDDANVVLSEISSIGRTPSDLKHIILTHAHKSHVGGLAALKQASGATVVPGPTDACAGARRGTRPTPAMLLAADLPDKVAFRVGFHNFYVITRYNRSPLYAMAVHDLAEALTRRVYSDDAKPLPVEDEADESAEADAKN